MMQPQPKIRKSPVFIVGWDRSGTTLLRLMLNQSSTLYITSETEFLIPLQQNQVIYGDFAQPYQRYFFIRDLQTNPATSKTFTFSVLGLTIAEAETALAQAAPTDFAGAAEAIFTAVAHKKHKQRWGDKTPHQVQNISSLAEAFPDAQFVHIIRDGRGVAVSIRKAGWLNGNILKIAQYWQKQVKAGISAGKALAENRYYEVFYEQLIQQPEATLRDLCDWLHLEYTPQMLNYYHDASSDLQPEHSNLFQLNQKPVDVSRAYACKSQLSKQDIADFESIAGNLLQTLGYELDGVKISPLIQLIPTFKQYLKPFLYRQNSQVIGNRF
jgi:hypothetical protein